MLIEVKKMKFNESAAWILVDEIRVYLKSLEKDVQDNIISAIVFGSLARGDFISGISDIDLLVVFKNETPIGKINEILSGIYKIAEKWKGLSKYEKVIDIPWLFEKDLPMKGSEKKSPFKFLGIYAFDFVRHYRVIFGKDIAKNLRVPNPKELIKERANRILKLLEKWSKEKNHYMIKILAGEAIRLAQIAFGEVTIDKRKVFKNFIKYVPEYSMKHFVHEIWKEYLSPEIRTDPEYIENCKKFVKATINMIYQHY